MSAVDFAALWRALPQPALLIEGDAILDANDAAEAFFALSAAQLRRRGMAGLFGAGARILDLVERARGAALSVADHRIEIETPESPARIVNVHAAAQGQGRVALTLSERGLAAQMDRALTHRAAARSITGMAAMLAHEIKNPLAGISGAAQLLEMSADAEGAELTALIREETARIEALLNRVEAFGDAHPAPSEPVNIHDSLDRAGRAAEAGFAAHLRVTRDYDPSLPPIPGDADRLMQLFLNLLKNAAEAAPKVGGAILIRTSYSPGVALSLPGGRRESVPLLVTIQDNGGGVPEAIRRDMFEPFVTSKSGGSGLGLALAARIVADHGGAIDCDSEPGRTAMLLRFPVWRKERP